MELDILNDTSISMEWTYACFNEKVGWINGPVGYTGVCGPCICGGTCRRCKPEDYQAVTEIVDKPEVLQFRMNVTTEDGYNKVYEFLQQFQGFCPKYTKIGFPEIRMIQSDKVRPEDQATVERVLALEIEFKNDQQIKEIYDEINRRLYQLKEIEEKYQKEARKYIPDAEFKCCKSRDEYDTYDVDDVISVYAPIHRFRIQEKNYNVCFTVNCMKGSKFYDFLEEYDLITRYWLDSIPKTRTKYIKK